MGNDFNVPDCLWLWRDGAWERSRFNATSHSTVSLDSGDIDNNGLPELFSSDMMPFDDSPATVAAWAPPAGHGQPSSATSNSRGFV